MRFTRKERSKSYSGARQSYHCLLESYNTSSSSGIKPPDLNDFLQQFEPTSSNSPSGSVGEVPDVGSSKFIFSLAHVYVTHLN